ncbi:MAG TPA: energy transducer TonB, partial [Myxococcota bacterium]|nr:energy transducer TonB [Myxococcota bacterium]
MDLDYRPEDGRRKGVGIALVLLLHALILWGLVSGMARKAVEVLKKPIEMKIVQEVVPPPPPPPP